MAPRCTSLHLCIYLWRLKYVFYIYKAGQPLADGWRAIVWGIIGDQDYKRDCLRLPNINSSCPCPLCDANTSSTPWFDFRREAAWVQTMKGAAAWDRCALFDLRGVTLASLYGDWMHDKNLGTDKVHPPLDMCVDIVCNIHICLLDIACTICLQSMCLQYACHVFAQ